MKTGTEKGMIILEVVVVSSGTGLIIGETKSKIMPKP